MVARSPLRLLAPIAVVAVCAALVIVVASSHGGSGGSTHARSTTTRTRVVSTRRTYRVRAGDTLTVISERTHVSTTALVALNPGLDPQLLQPGERLKLRP